MDFIQFTTDAKVAIRKLETYGLSCLVPTISIDEERPHPSDICVYAEPKNWKESGGLSGLTDNVRWSFQLNLIHPENQTIICEDILVGFIMLPKNRVDISSSESKINASFFVKATQISSFEFIPFKFVPAIENTFFISIASFYSGPIIRFDRPKNYNIYCLTAFLKRQERQYCVETVNRTQLLIPITDNHMFVYTRGMSGWQDRKNYVTDAKMSDYDLTINMQVLPIPKLPFDKNEFIEKTFHPNRVVNWCFDTEQKSQWSK